MSELQRPLADITVLEMGHIVAGPFCSLLLADLGAEVIKVENPRSGDEFRDSSPTGNSHFNYYNRNKKSIAIDLKNEDGKEAFYDLVRESDVVVENYSPSAADRLGVGYEQLQERNPELVYCSIKGFSEGPYQERPALDPVAEALSGLMSTTGYSNQPPARCGTSIADMTAGFFGALAVVGALRQRAWTGEGQKITSPMFEGTVGLMGGALAFSETYGDAVKPMGAGGHSWVPYDIFQTSDDKWVFIGPTSENHWQSFCETLDIGLEDDERFTTLPKRRDHEDALEEILEEEFRQYTREEVVKLFQDKNVPVAPVQDTLEATEDPHLNESGYFVNITTAEGEDANIDVPGSPIVASGFSRPEVEDPPALGEDTETVLESIGYQPRRIAELKTKGAINHDSSAADDEP